LSENSESTRGSVLQIESFSFPWTNKHDLGTTQLNKTTIQTLSITYHYTSS